MRLVSACYSNAAPRTVTTGESPVQVGKNQDDGGGKQEEFREEATIQQSKRDLPGFSSSAFPSSHKRVASGHFTNEAEDIPIVVCRWRSFGRVGRV